MTLAQWSGDAYLLTSQKLLQDQYEREFGDALQLVKGRENYLCERYPPPARVSTAHGLCRRPRSPMCQCPYARAKLAALNGPIFCTNTAYFLSLRQWQREQLRRRRLLVIDEAHNLEAQLVRGFPVAFVPDQIKAWCGGPLPRFASADEYRILFEDHVQRLDAELGLIDARLESLRPPLLGPEDLLTYPLPAEAQERRAGGPRRAPKPAPPPPPSPRAAAKGEWLAPPPPAAGGSLELVPLTVS